MCIFKADHVLLLNSPRIVMEHFPMHVTLMDTGSMPLTKQSEHRTNSFK